MSKENIDMSNLHHTMMQMRSYMEQDRPQSFAMVWNLFRSLCDRVKALYDYEPDALDIWAYAKKEQIKRFGREIRI